MSYIVATALICAFGAGVVFHKYVVSEAASIKQHVTGEVAKLREDFTNLLKKA